MPLGNFTSQFFANVYLNELDHYVKHILKAKYYIRYVDDFVILHDDKGQLEGWKTKIEEFLKDRLNLELHPDKSYISNLNKGVTFLGFRIFPNHMLVRKSNVGKFNRKLAITKTLYKEGVVRRDKVIEFLEGWLSFTKHANTFKYRKNLVKTFNKEFPIAEDKILSSNKKTANFLRKFDHSKLDFSVQQTFYLLLNKGMTIKEIANKKLVKESTIWKHISELIEYGQLPVWNVLPKKKIVRILNCILASSDKLKEIKLRLGISPITFDEIACVLAHVRFKDKVFNKTQNI